MSALSEADLSDPGYLRHCLRPDCTASFNIAEQLGNGPYVRGWHLVQMFAHPYLCQRHSGPVVSGAHKPAWLRDDDGKVIGVGCACGFSWIPAAPTTNGEYRGQWAAHLMRVDP